MKFGFSGAYRPMSSGVKALGGGAGGGGTKRTGSQTGGGGGYATGTYTFSPGNAYGVIIGGAGEGGNQSPSDNNQYNGYNTRAGNAGANSCLLYTSPSPRDRTRSRMPSSA